MKRRWLHFAVLWVVFVALGCAAVRARVSSEHARDWMRHTYEVELAIGAVRVALVDGADKRDLGAARVALRHLCSSTVDSAVQQTRCATLERMIDAAQIPEAQAVLAQMLITEQTYLEERRVRLEKAESTNVLVMRIAFVVALITSVWLVVSRERQRRAFEQQSAFFGAVLESIGDVVLAVDASGEFIVTNAVARSLFPAARVGNKLVDALKPELDLSLPDGSRFEVEKGPLAHALKGHAINGFMLSMKSREGRVWLKTSSRAVRDARGAIVGAVAVCCDVTTEKTHEDDIRALAVTDALTGCYNRRGFFMLGEQHARLATRTRAPFSVVFADLDGLKDINDVLGHDVGDAAISAAAKLLKATLRESDVVARLGGDEFVLLAAQTDERGASELVARVKRAVAQYNLAEQRAYQLALSFGSATFHPSNPQTLSELVADADHRMYAAKRTRRRPRVITGDFERRVKPETRP